MDIRLVSEKELDYYCEKKLLDSYNKYLDENKLQHSNESYKNFIISFFRKKS